jgi:hypothetical protein
MAHSDNKALADVLLSVADGMMQIDSQLKAFMDSTSIRLSSIEQRLSLVEAQRQLSAVGASGSPVKPTRKEDGTGDGPETSSAHEVWRSRNREQGMPLRTAAAPSSSEQGGSGVPPTGDANADNLVKAVQQFEVRLRALRAEAAATKGTSRRYREQQQDVSGEHTTLSSPSRSRDPPCSRVQEWLSAASTLDVSDDSVQIGEFLNTLMKKRRAGS